MGYNDDAKQIMVRLEEKVSPEFVETVTAEVLRLGPEVFKLLLAFPETLVYAGVRRWVVRTAMTMDRDAVVPMLLEGLSHTDWRIFEICRHALARMGGDVRDALVAHLPECATANGKIQNLWCLEQLADPFSPRGSGDPSLIPCIEEVARSDDSAEARAAAICTLSRCEAYGAEDTIVAALDDPAETVRLHAARAAGRLRLKSAVPCLVKMLEHEDAEVRADVVYALDRTGDPAAAPAVRALLDDDDWYVRWAAVAALGCLWTAENADVLEAACADPNRVVSVAAREALDARTFQ